MCAGSVRGWSMITELVSDNTVDGGGRRLATKFHLNEIDLIELKRNRRIANCCKHWCVFAGMAIFSCHYEHSVLQWFHFFTLEFLLPPSSSECVIG